MAQNLDAAFCDEIVTAVTTGGTVTVTAPVMARFMSANGNRTTPGTEITPGNSYAAGGVESGDSWGASDDGEATTTADLTVTNMPSCSVVGVEYWDSSTTPKRVAHGALTNGTQVVNDGGTFTLAAGSVTLTIG